MEQIERSCGILAGMERREAEVSEPEALVVSRARRGDRAAFEELVHSHLDQVWRVVWKILRHTEDTEDVVQEVFMSAQRALPEFRGGARFGTWLHRIAVNRALNHLQRASEKLRRASVPIGSAGGEDHAKVSAEPASGEATPLDRMEQSELGRRLVECLEKLPAAWRVVLALRVNEEMDYREIARVQETAIGTVRSRLARARLSLRQCMQGGSS